MITRTGHLIKWPVRVSLTCGDTSMVEPGWWRDAKVVHIYYDTGGGAVGLLESILCADVIFEESFMVLPEKIIPWQHIYRIERVS